MKIEITYTIAVGCYMACATINGNYQSAASLTSYADAKTRLLDTIRELLAAPPPENVEV